MLTRAVDARRWLPRAALPDLMVILERSSSALLALQMQVMAEFADLDRCGDAFELLAHTPGGDGEQGMEALDLAAKEAQDRLAVAEIAASLNIAHRTARVRLEQAQNLTSVPELLAQLRDGALDRGRATMVHEELVGLSDEQKLAVAGAIAPHVFDATTAQLRNRIRREAIAVDPEAAGRREEQARKGRRVSTYAKPDAMTSFTAILPADQAMRIHDFIDTCADRAARPVGDNRTIDQRRADIFAEVFRRLVQDGAVTVDQLLGNVDDLAEQRHRSRRKQGKDVSVQVHLTLESLLGLDLEPGMLERYGPISAELARAIAESAASLRVVLTDLDTGRTKQLGRQATVGSGKDRAGRRRARAGHDPGYRPGQRLRDEVVALWPHCTFPRCRQPSWRSDLDHRDPFNHTAPDDGGATTAENLQPLCRAHHRLKTFTDWTCRRDDDGSLDWISPTGHRYRVEPEPAIARSGRIVEPDNRHGTLSA